jgi:adenine-specific DNA-methyltransferase
MTRNKAPKTIRVETIKHQDKRINIPTKELQSFAAEDELNPKTITYPRDTSLDPQLVWKGKDEQDLKDLEVPAVPVYIQEKIHPRAIIDDIRAQNLKKEKNEPRQLSLFSDFNGLDFEHLIEFYQHSQNWANRMILGDSLLVMTSLAEKEGLKGKVQMIYIDPPYGIKFGSNWQVSTRKRDVKDGKVEDTVRQPEQIKAFRDTWELGIHSYLAYLRDRLILSRELLTETGSIFVQIGDENLHLVRCLLDEVFGSENFCGLIAFQKTGGFSPTLLSLVYDYIIWFSKDKKGIKYRKLFRERPEYMIESGYNWIQDETGVRKRITSKEINDKKIYPGCKRFQTSILVSAGASSLGSNPIEFQGIKYHSAYGTHWKTSSNGLIRLTKADRLIAISKTLAYIRFEEDFPVTEFSNVWDDTVRSTFAAEKWYIVQTSSKVIERCLLMTTDPGDLVLDPTCGSGTTAYVAEQWGRRWITIDTSRVALALARTRLMSAKYPYYLLMDSPEGLQKEAEITGSFPPQTQTNQDIKKGFVYKRVPHITLKSIANNEEIDIIHNRWQPKQDSARETLNSILQKNWQEWEVPHEADDTWPAAAKKAHTDFLELRRQRQKEIDASISRKAEQEILYDQPYEDNKRIRVTGPFTVESLSPHRVLAPEREMPKNHGQAGTDGGEFENMIIENLRRSGVKTTKKGEGIKFISLDPYAGTYIQGQGIFTDSDGSQRRVAVCIGPEHGTVGPELVKEAAKEAVKGIGFDVLVVCGFAFDPYVSEESKQFGKLNVIISRMNPDLAMGGDLLKKTGAGNLFMVFGEPDIEIKTQKDGNVKVDIRGVDVYDPTTGQVRSNSIDDIACWFIDTEYNEESFFVRQAYFLGAEEPYDKLKRALRAEIDESAWNSLYTNVSRPFPVPGTGKIAVKVINHYGDEVLKVYRLNKEDIT